MTRILGTAAVCALVAGGAMAQEAATLTTLNVEATGENTGFYGEIYASTAEGVMKTDTPIVETPRSVSVVRQVFITVLTGGPGGRQASSSP